MYIRTLYIANKNFNVLWINYTSAFSSKIIYALLNNANFGELGLPCHLKLTAF